MTLILTLFSKAQLKLALYDKQRLHAQMVKDKVTGPTKDHLQKEIDQIVASLYTKTNAG